MDNKWNDFCNYYKLNPIEFYENYFGIKLTVFQKVKIKIYNVLSKHLKYVIYEQNKVLIEMLIEPYGTTRYNILKLHLAILDLRIVLIREIFRIN